MSPNSEPPSNRFGDKQLDIFHDHYKQSLIRLREYEQTRDRWFFWTIALYTVLIFEIGYPSAVNIALGKVPIPGFGDIDLKDMPLSALLHVTWFVALVMTLQYCQATVRVNRHFPYIRALECALSSELGGGNLYERAGKIYLQEYPPLLDLAWHFYVFIFPVLAMLAALLLITWEWRELPYSLLDKVADAVIALGLLVVLFSYRIHPTLAQRWPSWRTARQRKYTTAVANTEDDSFLFEENVGQPLR